MFSCSSLLEVRHLAIRGGVDDLGVGLEKIDSQEPVVVGRLIFRGDAKPFVVRVECHRSVSETCFLSTATEFPSKKTKLGVVYGDDYFSGLTTIRIPG